MENQEPRYFTFIEVMYEINNKEKLIRFRTDTLNIVDSVIQTKTAIFQLLQDEYSRSGWLDNIPSPKIKRGFIKCEYLGISTVQAFKYVLDLINMYFPEAKEIEAVTTRDTMQFKNIIEITFK
jgi:hypothetical protein